MGCWPVVLVAGTIFGYLRISSGGPACQCGWYVPPMRPVSEAGLPGFASDSQVADRDVPPVLEEQPFASSEMDESMDTDLLPELSGETRVSSTLLDGLTADLLPARADSYRGVPSGQDVGDGSGVNPVGQCAVVG